MVSVVSVRRIAFLTLLMLVIALSGAFAQDEKEVAGDYRIGAGDVLQIVVWGNDQLSTSLPVRPDGMISLPLLNDVQASGRTPMELRDVIAQRLGEFVSAPQVTVIVTSVSSFKVSVLGNVRSPGRISLNEPTTVLDVIAMVGGFVEFTNPDDTYVLRPVEGAYRRIPFKYSTAITAAGKTVNFYVMPGDFIIAP